LRAARAGMSRQHEAAGAVDRSAQEGRTWERGLAASSGGRGGLDENEVALGRCAVPTPSPVGAFDPGAGDEEGSGRQVDLEVTGLKDETRLTLGSPDRAHRIVVTPSPHRDHSHRPCRKTNPEIFIPQENGQAERFRL
jgi:hypothetical protein